MMTIREFKAKHDGFFEYQNNYLKQQSWLIGLMALKAINATGKHPYPPLSELMGDKPEQEESDEDLFKLAEEKGIEIPEGVI